MLKSLFGIKLFLIIIENKLKFTGNNVFAEIEVKNLVPPFLIQNRIQSCD